MHETMITRLRRRLGARLGLKHALAWLTLWSFGWGTVVLVGRASLDDTPEWLWWGLASGPWVAGIAFWLGWRRSPTRSQLRALVDRTSHCGGMLMASEEEPLGGWQQSLPAATDLDVRWQGGRSWSIFLAAVLFLAVTLLFPQDLMSWNPDPRLEIGGEVQKLAAQIEVLKQENVIEPTRAEFLKERLQQVKDDASGKNPVKTLEALDHVREQLAKAAQEAAEAAINKTEKLGKAEGLTEGIKQNQGELDPKVEKEAFAELAALVQKATAENNALGMQLDPELLKQLQAAKLTPEQMKKLAEALRGSKADLAKMLGKLHAAKLIDIELLKRCEKAGECNCAGFLKEQGGKMSIAQILAQCQGQIPGKGGVTEGPGSTPIAWNQNTSEEGAKFKEETLPPAELAKLKESLLMGVGKADPKNGKEIVPSQGGVLSTAKPGGGAALTQTILPRHKATVERFFDRPKDK